MGTRIGLAEAFRIMGVDVDAADHKKHRLIGKLFFQGAGRTKAGEALLMVGGVVIAPAPFPVDQDTAECWWGSVILEPTKRCIDTGHHFRGHGMQAVLTDGFGDPNNYGKVIDA